VVSVGSFEPRKNHLALLQASELLWQEGLRFELVLIGGMSWDPEVSHRIAELQEQGRPLTVLHRAPQPVVDRAYEQARFSVFASLHEGYGLPIAESLAAGTPVITSDFGSMLEIAQRGGTLTIDPRNDTALLEAMRLLLLDDAKLTQLRAEIRQRPARDWSDYAAQLWQDLVEPELAALEAAHR
jgi:glycosyltransferase involved in cell wall biosynthesis